MQISPITPTLDTYQATAATRPAALDKPDDAQVRKVFDNFVGETFYGQMLKAMRKTQHQAAYFNGGRAEEIFQQQFDQVVAEKLSHTTADKLSGPMYQLFALNRR